MSTKQRARSSTKSRTRETTSREARDLTLNIYRDFERWHSKKIPQWHPVRKMRYIFYRMIGGCTITDAIAEIHWSASEFWHLIDLKRHGPFREEYKRAKLLQGRSFSDSVITIAEGRDRITRRHKRRMDQIIDRLARKMAKTKSPLGRKLLVAQLMNDLREHDKIIITRNKLQIDASKWIAKMSNPAEFSESSKLSLGTNPGDPDNPETKAPTAFLLQFVGPDGKVVPV